MENIVDLERYPIMDLESPAGNALVERCRKAFRDDVSCLLRGFVKPQAVARMVADAEAKEADAFLS